MAQTVTFHYSEPGVEAPTRKNSSPTGAPQKAPTTDLVREAFFSKDVEASKSLHEQRLLDPAVEKHNTGVWADQVKSIVYGGLDGIITTFAIVTSVAGASNHLGPEIILILGIAHLFSDALAMGMGDSLSEMAETDSYRAERRREKWEMENNMEGEIQEMIEIYVNEKGIERADAEEFIRILAKNKKAFLDHMMAVELGMAPEDEDAEDDEHIASKEKLLKDEKSASFLYSHVPFLHSFVQFLRDREDALKAGAVTFFSFVLFGVVPLLPYIVSAIISSSTVSSSTTGELWASVAMTVGTLFLLGALKAIYVDLKGNIPLSGCIMAFNGSFAAAVAYVVGVILAFAFGSEAASQATG